jgi:hypothetical protein
MVLGVSVGFLGVLRQSCKLERSVLRLNEKRRWPVGGGVVVRKRMGEFLLK